MADAAELVVRIRGDASDLEATISGVSQQLEELERTQSNTNGVKGVRESTSAYQGLASQLKDTGKGIKEVGESIDTITKPIQYASTALAAGGVASAKFAIDFENNFANVKKTVDGTPEQIEKIRQEIIDMTTVGINGHSAIPETTAELTELAAAGGQLGIKTENISKFTETMAMLGTATNLYGEEGAATLAKFANVTKMDQENFDRLGSSIVDLGNNFATTESDIANMSMRLAGAGTQIGLSQADILGIATALSSVGIEAEMGGSAFSKAMIAMQMATTNGYTQVNDVMNKTGMSLRDLQLLSANNSKDFKSLADGLGYTSTELNSMISSGVQLENFAKITGKTTEEFKNLFDSSPAEAIDAFIKGLQNADGAGENAISMLQDMGFTEVRLRDSLLRLANSEAGITEAVTRSNTAWNENIALQNEFDAKAETTASQMKIAKQNIIEAARGIGETMLPSIKDASTTVADFAKGLSQMSDEQKKVVVNTGATVIALGALSKVGVGVIKGAGDFVEAVGNIKKAFSAGGALAKFAPTLTSIGATAGPAALAVAGIATAAIAGKVAYDKWYQSQYRWSEGLSEGNEKVKESLEKYKSLNDIQGQIKSLKMVIESPESSQEQVDNAKSKLEEIKEMLSQEYNLVINSDNSNLDDAVEQVTKLSKNELQSNINNQRAELSELINNNSNYVQTRREAQENYNKELELQTKYSEAQSKVSNITAKIANNEITAAEGYAKAKEIYINTIGSDYENAITDESDKNAESVLASITGSYKVATGILEDYKKQLDDLDGSHQELHDTAEELSNMELELLKLSVANKDNESVEKSLSDMKEFISAGKLDMNSYAQAAALAMNGVDNLESAWEKAANGDGTELNNIINDYVHSMQKFGAYSGDIATNATLLQNGFKTVKEAAENGKLDVITEQANELAHSMGLIPENKRIVIDADGNISVVKELQQAVDDVNTKGDVKLQVSAEGDISVLNTADSKLQELINNNQVTITFNVDTGGFDINDLNGNKLGEITATGKVIWTNDSTEPDNYTAPPKEGNVTFKKNSAEPDGYQPEDKFATVHYTVSVEGSSIEGLSDKSAPAARFGSTGTFVKKKVAKGTQNFEGGLAMVNDEKGISDPRELIVDKGRAFIPQGKDVLLPLSKGAKVYTASQTKAIMNGMGIPHYATGKDNSDAFTSAKDDWTHYTKTHAVTTAQELEKWLEFQEKFKSNDKDIADIEEQIFSLTQKRTQELNNLSKSYIEERAALNDWDDNGDNPIDAFTRIRDRNMAEFEAGRMTWEDYTTEMSSIGSTLYDNMTEYSRDWLEHQEKYNGMSVADYIAGIGRIQTYTEQMYAQGIISHKEYVEAKNKLNDEYLDKRKEQIEQEYNISKNYISEHTYFNDWDDNGDNPLDAYNRVMDRHREELSKGEITQEEYDKYQSELGSDMYSERVEQSKNWLDEQRKYYGMTDEEYIAGLKRIQQYTQEYYDLGLISRKEYNENMTELNHDMFDQAGESFDDMLQQQQDYINKLRDEFSAQEQALQDSWTVEDRKADMSETQAQLDIYANAVTDRGQQKYKELQEQMKQLQRDEELYQLQVKNNATIEKLEAEYDALENSKTDFIKSIATNIDSIDVTGIVADITQEVSGGNDKITKTLGEIIEAIKGIKIEQQNYNNNSKITINTTDSAVLGSYV